MELSFIIAIFLLVILASLFKPEISLAMLLNINLFRAIPYVDYNSPYYGYYNESDIFLGAVLPALSFILIIVRTIWNKKKIKYKVDMFDYFMLILLSVIILSIVVSPSVGKSIFYAGIFMILGVPFYFVTKLYFSNTNNLFKSMTLFIKTNLLFALIFSSVSLYLHRIAKYPYERMTFPGVYPIMFCLFLCLALLFLVMYYMKPTLKKSLSKKSRLLFSLPVLGIVIFSIIKSNTRGPVFALILAFVTVLFVFFKIKFKVKIIQNFFLVVITGFVAFITFFDVNKIASRFINLYTENSDSISPRLIAYFDSIKLLLTKPWGISVGTFDKYYSGADRVEGSYAHNLFMELISSFGLIGLIICFIIIIQSLKEFNFIEKYQKKIFSDNLFFICIVLFLFFFFETQFSFTLNTHKGWYLSMALYSVFKWNFLKNNQPEIT